MKKTTFLSLLTGLCFLFLANSAPAQTAEQLYQKAVTAGFEDQIALTDKAIKLKPDYAEAYILRADAYYHLDNYDKALADYTAFFNLPGSSKFNNRALGMAYAMRGTCHLKLKNFDAAIADFDKALKVRPTLSGLESDYGFAYLGKKEYRKAIAYFMKVVEYSGSEIHFGLAEAHRGLGNNKKAEEFEIKAKSLKIEEDEAKKKSADEDEEW